MSDNKLPSGHSLMHLFIRLPKLGHLVFFLVLALGLISLFSLRYEVVPKIDMGIINITTSKAGASAEEIELAITTPLEDEILKVNGVRKVVSRSMESLSLIIVISDSDADESQLFKVLSDIQRAVDRAETRLPPDLIEKPRVEKLSTDNLAVAELHISGAVSEDLLRQQARLWERKLRELSGVSGVEKVGFRRKEISIEPDQAKLLQLGMDHNEIQRAVQLRNVRDSGGAISTSTGEKKVVTIGQFQEPQDVGNVIVRNVSPGNEVRLRDVAQIHETYEDWQVQVRNDGRLSIALMIKKRADADELKTIEEIRHAISNTKSPPGIELNIVNDVSRFTLDMLDALIGNALLGLVSVFLILWLFLGRQLAFWVSVGLPFSILATFCGMLMLGLSVNSLTLMSIILVLGMLVDDAIVTGESIQARKESGLDPFDAAIRGTKDIAAPVFVSVLTTILAFLPILFLGGIEGKFVAAIPLVVGLTLLVSLFESKFLLPAHLAHSSLSIKPKPWLENMQDKYQRLIEFLLKNRKISVITIVSIFSLVTLLSGSLVRFQLYPETAVDTINISLELPTGSTFNDTVSKVEEIEHLVRTTVPSPDLLNVTSQIGHHDTDPYGGSMGRNQAWALVTVFLKPQNQVQQDQRETLSSLQRAAAELSGFDVLRVEPLKDTPVIGKPVELEILSDGPEKLVVSQDIKTFLAELEGTTDVWDSVTDGESVFDLQFDYHRLAANNLSVRTVSEAVRISMDGLIISEQQMSEERVFYRLRLPKHQREKLPTLHGLSVINETGQSVALSNVAEITARPGISDVKRYNGRRTITVFADIDRSVTDVPTINNRLAAFIDQQEYTARYPGLSFYQGGELEQHKASYADLGIAFLACVMLIFLVLVVLFNSLSQPMLVLAVLPFSIMGVFLTFAIQDLPLSFLALIGVLGLIGVLVNDAVVMIFTLNKEAHKGSAEKVAELATKRFRPIVLTSLTTLAGLFPTAYGLGGYNPFIAPMVMTMAWGVAIGTLISLLLLPCLFMINDDLRAFVRRMTEKVAEAKMADWIKLN